MSECPCDLDKFVDPICCANGMCSRETEEIQEDDMERAELGVDGNAGFALLGDDLQSGEAEFVEFDKAIPVGTKQWHEVACAAATKAYSALKARLSDRTFSYYLGPSHPNHC